jgi:hypothetical protein
MAHPQIIPGGILGGILQGQEGELSGGLFQPASFQQLNGIDQGGIRIEALSGRRPALRAKRLDGHQQDRRQQDDSFTTHNHTKLALFIKSMPLFEKNRNFSKEK